MCVVCGLNNCSCSSSPPLSYEGGGATPGASTAISLLGHPIIMLDDPSDLALFDFGTGEGSGIWSEWALCDGQSHVDSNEDTITTPDLRDRFIIGAGVTYGTGDTGGEAEVTLDESTMPAHTHVLSDPGHTHTASSAPHTHVITDPGHTHAKTDAGHTHSLSIASDGSHDHDVVIETITLAVSQGDGITVYTPGVTGTDDTETTDTEADHNHSGSTVGNSVTGISYGSAMTGISAGNTTATVTVDDEVTGITLEDTGGGVAHNNLPPYYALIFIKRIG